VSKLGVMRGSRVSSRRPGPILAAVPGFAAFALVLAPLFGACDDNGGGGQYSGYAQSKCSQYAGCGACTAISGCGWCFNATGGMCAADPDPCAAQVSEFTWTWDPGGCPNVDASVEPLDAGIAQPDASSDNGASDDGATSTDERGDSFAE